jgi:beta-lactamase class A
VTEPVAAGIEAVFREAGCAGQLCVQSLDGSQEVALDADRLVVSASVVKVSIALTAETWIAEGRLDPRERVWLRAGGRTPGPVGFSLYEDDVEVSVRDLVVPMLTISDNAATDALLDLMGADAVNQHMAGLGLTDSVVVGRLQEILNSIGRDAGFAGLDSMLEWFAQPHRPEEEAAAAERMYASATALKPECTTRTTPREMVTLLRLIWTGQAGPEQACRRVRKLMGSQLTKHRLASGFRSPVRVAAKSGGLVGVVRNEVGVITYPDGAVYAAAVFTQTPGGQEAGADDAAVNAAIGKAAADAVGLLRDGQGQLK